MRKPGLDRKHPRLFRGATNGTPDFSRRVIVGAWAAKAIVAVIVLGVWIAGPHGETPTPEADRFEAQVAGRY